MAASTRATWSTGSATRSKRRRRRSSISRPMHDAPYGAVMTMMDQLHEAQIENVGLITETRRKKPGEAGAGEATDGARTSSPRRRQGRLGRDAARQCGHERHAADRRAARAARHLHGGAADDAEGHRHQPAPRVEQPADARRRPIRSSSKSRPITGSPSTSSRSTSASLHDDAAQHLRDAPGEDDVHRRRADAAATARSSP